MNEGPPPSAARRGFALVWGLFLGLAVLKFGNPVTLEARLSPPSALSDWLYGPWPGTWSRAIAAVLLLGAAAVAALTAGRGSGPRFTWKWALPAAWLAWQWVASTRTADPNLTSVALAHFAVTAGAWAAGWLAIGRRAWKPWLCAGLFGAFAFCSVRAANQKLFEFRADHQAMLDGQATGWTNYPAAVLDKMRADEIIVRTNGVDIANPVILYKLEKGRAHGTLGNPNALAGLVLLLGPLSLTAAWRSRAVLRPAVAALVTLLAAGLTAGALVFSGSKAGWLIAVVMASVAAGQRLPPRRRRMAAALLLAAGAAGFGWRFRHYLAGGATSAGARFEYWRAAVREIREEPLTGVGPGAFLRAYERLKPPEAEPTRLAHNDYLEQFSDSGVPGGLAYFGWIACVAAAALRVWNARGDPWLSAVALGVAGWFVQAFVEFGLYIPALAWIAFTLAGVLADDAGVSPAFENIPTATLRPPPRRRP